MKKHFVFFYFMKNSPDKIRETVPAHVEYWKNSNVEKYKGGPFADRTGGLISFVTTSLEEATTIIMQDPFLTEDLIENKWIKEWIVE